MPDNQQILDFIDRAYAARTGDDRDALASLWAPGATYRMAGDPALLGDFPAGQDEAGSVVGELIEQVRFERAERLDAIVAGGRAAIRWRVDLSVRGGPVVTTEMCDFWTLDEEGRATDLVQFIDTALLRQLLGGEG